MASNRGKSKPLGDVIAEQNAEDTQRRARVGVEAFAQLPDDAVIYIWRRDDESKEFAATGVTFAPDEFSVEKVRELLGGGTFQARAMVRDEQDRKIPGGQRQFKIEGAPKFPGSGVAVQVTPVQDARGGVPGSNARESIIDMGIMAMFKQMQDNSQMQMMMMKEMVESRKSSVDWGVILAAVAPIAASLITTMGSKKDPNEIAAELIEKLKPSTNGTADLLKTAETMVRLRELFPGGGGGGGDAEDPTTIALKTFGPVVAEILMAKQAERGGAPTTRVAAPAQVQIPTTVPVQQSAETQQVTEPGWVTALRPHVGQLARIAASGKDPYDFAHTVMSFFMPDAHKGTVRELVLPGAEDAAAKLLDAFPPLQAYPGWVVEFIDGVRQELCPELYDDDGDEKEGGDADAGA